MSASWLQKEEEIGVTSMDDAGIKLIPVKFLPPELWRSTQKRRFCPFLAPHTNPSLSDTVVHHRTWVGIFMDQNAENTAPTGCVSPFAITCPPAMATQLRMLCSQMEKALTGIANYYGRQRLAPYQHEPKAWVDVREALQAASEFREKHSGVSPATTGCVQLPQQSGANVG